MSWRARGLRPWLWQRISALYLALFTVAAVAGLLTAAPMDFEQWRGWVAHPLFNTALVLFWASLLIHAWVGMRDVVMDYVHNDSARLSVLILIGFGLVAMGIWVLRVLVRVAVT